jgi:hypothetical protein
MLYRKVFANILKMIGNSGQNVFSDFFKQVLHIFVTCFKDAIVEGSRWKQEFTIKLW